MDCPQFNTPLQAAIAAARDFKQLLDIQAPDTLSFPKHKGDARTTATYACASRFLEQATAQGLEEIDRANVERRALTTTVKLRDTILRCAREATEAEPNSVEFRLHSFIAKMSGSMEAMGERELDEALWGLLQAPAQPSPPVDFGSFIEWRNRKLFSPSSSASQPGSTPPSQDPEASLSKSAPAPEGL